MDAALDTASQWSERRREWAKRQLLDFPKNAPGWCPQCKRVICVKHYWRGKTGELFFQLDDLPLFVWNTKLGCWDDEVPADAQT